MSSRIPLPYSPEVLKYFRNPKNVGSMDDATIHSTAGSPACGDMIKLYLKIEDDVIKKASFESYGCAANIAAASILTELITGKDLKSAWMITWKDISDRLGGLPPIKYHCSILAVGALKKAIRSYFNNLKTSIPEWLPKELTPEEKQTMEEESIMRMYTDKVSILSGKPLP